MFGIVFNQTLGDFEIICVNDGSSDNSSAILEKYTKKDSWIKVKSRFRSLLEKGRNMVSGKYIQFLDLMIGLKKILVNLYIIKSWRIKFRYLMFCSKIYYESEDWFSYDDNFFNNGFLEVNSGIKFLLIKMLQILILQYLEDSYKKKYWELMHENFIEWLKIFEDINYLDENLLSFYNKEINFPSFGWFLINEYIFVELIKKI